MNSFDVYFAAFLSSAESFSNELKPEKPSNPAIPNRPSWGMRASFATDATFSTSDDSSSEDDDAGGEEDDPDEFDALAAEATARARPISAARSDPSPAQA